MLCKDKVERERKSERAAAETAAPRRWAEERRRMWAVLTRAAGRERRGEAKSGLLSTKASSQQGL